MHRAQFVRTRLGQINKSASEIIIENGILLIEVKEQSLYKEWGWSSFDEAINAMQESGELSYGARQARNFLAIGYMISNLELTPADIDKIGIGKLREIATVPGIDTKQKLLAESAEMSTSEVQKEARRLRDAAAGRETDPLEPVTLMMTSTMRQFFGDCVSKAREVYEINDDVPVVAVLVDSILPEWFSSAEHPLPVITGAVIEDDLVG